MCATVRLRELQHGDGSNDGVYTVQLRIAVLGTVPSVDGTVLYSFRYELRRTYRYLSDFYYGMHYSYHYCTFKVPKPVECGLALDCPTASMLHNP